MGGIGPPRATGDREVTWIEVQIAKARADALEEAAKIAELYPDHVKFADGTIAAAIRAAKDKP